MELRTRPWLTRPSRMSCPVTARALATSSPWPWKTGTRMRRKMKIAVAKKKTRMAKWQRLKSCLRWARPCQRRRLLSGSPGWSSYYRQSKRMLVLQRESLWINAWQSLRSCKRWGTRWAWRMRRGSSLMLPSRSRRWRKREGRSFAGPAKGLSWTWFCKKLCSNLVLQKGFLNLVLQKGFALLEVGVVDFSARSWCKRKAGASCPNTLSLTLW